MGSLQSSHLCTQGGHLSSPQSPYASSDCWEAKLITNCPCKATWLCLGILQVFPQRLSSMATKHVHFPVSFQCKGCGNRAMRAVPCGLEHLKHTPEFDMRIQPCSQTRGKYSEACTIPHVLACPEPLTQTLFQTPKQQHLKQASFCEQFLWALMLSTPEILRKCFHMYPTCDIP